MTLLELITLTENAYERWGDLECFIDSDIDENEPVVDFACEIIEGHVPRIVLTTYELPDSHLRLVK
jgi:hypothetical protein